MKGYYIEPNRFEMQRFFSKVHHVTPSGCWVWRPEGLNGAGRPMFGARHGVEVAARVAYRWFVGPIPLAHDVDHLCYRRACVNPAHLEAVTRAENIRRALARHTHCRNGHPKTPENQWKNGSAGTVCKVCIQASRARQLYAKAASL